MFLSILLGSLYVDQYLQYEEDISEIQTEELEITLEFEDV